MSTSLVPYGCAICGDSVLPNRNGYWVSKQYSGYCDAGGSSLHYPGYPLEDSAQHRASQRSRKKTIGLLSGVLVIVGGLIAGLLTIVIDDKPTFGITIAPEERFKNNFHPGPNSSNSLAPVPCDPHLDQGKYCFPPKNIKGKDFIARVRNTQDWEWLRQHSVGWTCFDHGEKDLLDKKVKLAAKCTGAGKDVNKSSGKRYKTLFSIGYRTNTGNPVGRVNVIRIEVSTSAHTNEGEYTDVQDLTNLAKHVVSGALHDLWPNNKKIRASAMTAFRSVQSDCRTMGYSDPERFKYNYVIQCESILKVNLGGFISISESIIIKPAKFLGGN